MKKFILMVVAVVALGLTSCQKCVTCTITDANGDVITTTPETCGNKKLIEEFEETTNAAYDAFPDYNISCVSE